MQSKLKLSEKLQLTNATNDKEIVQKDNKNLSKSPNKKLKNEQFKTSTPKELNNKGLYTNKLLKNRILVLDWILITIKKLKLLPEVFFNLVKMLDKILIIFEYDLSIDDIHLISTVCMWIQVKLLEVNPVSLKVIKAKVLHNKYNNEELINIELIVLRKLNFRLPKSNILNILYDLIFNTNNNIQSKNVENSNKTLDHSIKVTRIFLCLNENISRTNLSGIVHYSLNALYLKTKDSFFQDTLVKLMERSNSLNLKLDEIIESSKLIGKIMKKEVKNCEYLVYSYSCEFEDER